jgi:hypothetical protein
VNTLQSRIIASVLGLAFVGVQAANAQTEYFNGSGAFTWFHQGSPATPNHIWITGDYWQQDFGTVNETIAGATFNLYYNDNILQTGSTLTLQASIDGTNVGPTFTVVPGQASSLNLVTTFSPMFVGDLTVAITAVSTVAPGQGSVSLQADGNSSNVTLQAVPEPFSMSLLGLGALALVRKRRA